ncbi:MAG: site-specific DNA-methyltransferase [Pseudomonadota bacterium]|nr:site-specific DNA-methyltransferase [Pseudomonadota bacterium]
MLGEAVDVGKERYGMNWPGKADCFKAIQSPSLATLRPCPEESIDFDTTENLILEGDNLEVLKLLQKSYLGKVKMIYIDPPYNTGNDFIYPDDYSESLRTYLEYTGQVDAQGKKFSTNTEADGRFHSKWLNMMYPRLYLAQNLLRDDGFILVSINDVELHSLRFMLNDIFGEENWLGTLVWKGATDNNPTRIAVEHEYLVCYGRDKDAVPAVWTNQSDDAKVTMLSEYERLRHKLGGNVAAIQADFRRFVRDNAESLVPLTHYNRVDERGPYTGSRKVHNPKPGGYKYDVVHPLTQKVCVPPANGYRFPKATMDSLIAEERILFGEDETQIIQIKEYLKDFEGKLSSVITLDSRAGANEMEALFGDRKVFPHPKPSILVREVADFCLHDSDFVLDFFAGSGTTAHFVLDLNKQDGGNRKFILVQLPEPTDRADYRTIADICKERVRRVIKKLNDADGAANSPVIPAKAGIQDPVQISLSLDSGQSMAGMTGAERHNKQDRGFRVFKLDESSFKTWEADQAKDAEGLARQLELHVEHIREGRTADDLLYEILLKSGFPLTTPVKRLTLAGKTVYGVSGGAMLICLESELTLEAIRAMASMQPERVVCLDSSFAGNDPLKANAVQIFKTKGVTSFKTV